MGIASIGAEAKFTAGNGFVNKVGGGESLNIEPSNSFGKPSKFGGSAVVSIGADIGGYTNINNKNK